MLCWFARWNFLRNTCWRKLSCDFSGQEGKQCTREFCNSRSNSTRKLFQFSFKQTYTLIMSVSIVIIIYLAVTTYRPTKSSHGQPTPPSSTATWWLDPSHHSSVPTPFLPWLASSRTQRRATGTWWRSVVSFWCPSLLALRRQSRSPRSPGKFTCQNIYTIKFYSTYPCVKSANKI